MKTPPMAVLGLGLAVFMVSTATTAHHGTANYNTGTQVTVKGTVSDFQFNNPHVLIYIQAKDESGKTTNWQGELTSPNHLSRAGWKKDTIKPGDEITISGYPTKSGSPEIWIQKVIAADGTPIDTSGGN
jgi:hypothetical protein